MAAFTAQDVKTLREKTGCGMMDCKKALTNADGDMDKAIDFLREQGLAKAAKKASRIAAEGVAYATTNADASVGVVIEVNAETDFVAKNDSFMDFVRLVLRQLSSRILLMLMSFLHLRQQAQSRQLLNFSRRRFRQSARTSRSVVLSVWKVLA